MKRWHVIISPEDSAANKICHVSSRLRCSHVTCPVVLLALPLSHVYSQDILVRSCPVKSDLYYHERNPKHFIFYSSKSITSSPTYYIFCLRDFKIMALVKYMCCFYSAVPYTIQCLSAAAICLIAFKKFKINKTPCKVQIPARQ